MNPLFIILFRVLQGDRLRKPTPDEEQRWSAVFLLVAAGFGLAGISMKVASGFWERAGTFALTVAMAVAVCAFWFGTNFLGRHVPAKISWTAGAIAWATLFFLALTGRLT
jgi:hypothetical protein